MLGSPRGPPMNGQKSNLASRCTSHPQRGSTFERRHGEFTGHHQWACQSSAVEAGGLRSGAQLLGGEGGLARRQGARLRDVAARRARRHAHRDHARLGRGHACDPGQRVPRLQGAVPAEDRPDAPRACRVREPWPTCVAADARSRAVSRSARRGSRGGRPLRSWSAGPRSTHRRACARLLCYAGRAWARGRSSPVACSGPAAW